MSIRSTTVFAYRSDLIPDRLFPTEAEARAAEQEQAIKPLLKMHVSRAKLQAALSVGGGKDGLTEDILEFRECIKSLAVVIYDIETEERLSKYDQPPVAVVAAE